MQVARNLIQLVNRRNWPVVAAERGNNCKVLREQSDFHQSSGADVNIITGRLAAVYCTIDGMNLRERRLCQKEGGSTFGKYKAP